MTPLDSALTVCRQPPGTVAPIVELVRCEGKGDCVEVCPEQVFELRRIDAADYAELGWRPRLKLRVHGMRVAYTPKADACLGCGLCVAACPEHAISLRRRMPQP
jgi:NAD-dependent dihydropyrimidine dehydrogenase PreA subunit